MFKRTTKRIDLPYAVKYKKLILTHTFLHIGKLFGVSDNAVRKWCKKYNLPYKYNDIKQLKDTVKNEC